MRQQLQVLKNGYRRINSGSSYDEFQEDHYFSTIQPQTKGKGDVLWNMKCEQTKTKQYALKNVILILVTFQLDI